ncbi:MAG: hypothetical protein KIT84_02940 [Labilithrix sp.]|nr:hypothetical protein [Labilithrix sp.]MCW5809938.1 hypothetical protein [Labilithrix sp.]
MNHRSSVIASTVALFAVFALVGCAGEEGDGGEGTTTQEEDRQTISGRLDTGEESGGGLKTKTKSVGVTNGDAQLHVVAHRLGPKGQVNVNGDVDAVVAADGTFDLKLARGARYVLEVERGNESVAFFGWNERGSTKKTTILGISSATRGQAAVSLGRVKVVGNGAVAEHCLCESFDANDTTGIDLSATWFVAAHGAVISADEALAQVAEALEQAAKALAAASDALDEAAAATDEATRALEEARERAGRYMQ